MPVDMVDGGHGVASFTALERGPKGHESLACSEPIGALRLEPRTEAKSRGLETDHGLWSRAVPSEEPRDPTSGEYGLYQNPRMDSR